MKCRIENTYLRNLRQQFANGIDTGEVGRIVQRSYFDALFDFCNHFVVDQHALVEFFTAVNQTVANRIDFVE